MERALPASQDKARPKQTGRSSQQVFPVLLAGLLVFTGWFGGGRVSWFDRWAWLIQGICAAGLALLGLAVLRQCTGRPVRARSWIVATFAALPWILLLVQIGVSLANPSSTSAETGENWQPLTAANHDPGLPSTAYASGTWGVAPYLVGLMAVAAASFLGFQHRSEIRGCFTAVYINALALCILGTIIRLTGGNMLLGLGPPTGPSWFATFHYHNHWVAFALLSLCAGLAVFVVLPPDKRSLTSRRSRAPIYLLPTALFPITFALIGSRSGLIFSGFLALVGLGAWAWSTLARKGGQAAASRFFLVLVLAVLGFGMAWSAAGKRILQEWRGTEREMEILWERDEDEGVTRLLLNRDTIRLAQIKPVWGWGYGTYKYVIPGYLGSEHWVVNKEDGGLYPRSVEFAHNDWLHHRAELGWAGLSLLLGTPLLVALWTLRRGRLNPFTCMAWLGCGLVLILAIWEFPAACPAVGVLFAVMAGAGGRYALLEAARPTRSERRRCLPDDLKLRQGEH